MEEPYTGVEHRRQAWHLNRGVPLTLIAALIIQTIALVVWAVRLEGRVEKTETTAAESRQRLIEMETRERESNKLTERVVRVETMLESVQRTVNRIDDATTKRGQR